MLVILLWRVYGKPRMEKDGGVEYDGIVSNSYKKV
jgi:hypothetical protein